MFLGHPNVFSRQVQLKHSGFDPLQPLSGLTSTCHSGAKLMWFPRRKIGSLLLLGLSSCGLPSCGGIAVDDPSFDASQRGPRSTGGAPSAPEEPGAGGSGIGGTAVTGGFTGTGGSMPGDFPPLNAEGAIETAYLQHLPSWVQEVGDRLAMVGMGNGVNEISAFASRGPGPIPDWLSYIPEASAASNGALDGDGNVYLVGTTYSKFVPDQAGGLADAIVVRFDADTGELLWKTQWGGKSHDRGEAARMLDATTLLVAGETAGFPEGPESQGESDIFLRAVDVRSGEVLWTQTYGTTGRDEVRELLIGIAGDVYLVGKTSGAFTAEPAQGEEGYILRVSASSGELFAREVIGGSGDDEVREALLDADGRLWIGGTTTSALFDQTHRGGEDIFVARLDSQTLSPLSLHQFGTPEDDRFVGLESGSAEEIYVAGFTSGTWSGQKSFGGQDGFHAQISARGDSLENLRQFGTASDDRLSAFVASKTGDLIFIGPTRSGSDWNTYYLRLSPP